jgi:hypothetical protein
MAEYGLKIFKENNVEIYTSTGIATILYSVKMPWQWGGMNHPNAPKPPVSGNATYPGHVCRIYDPIFTEDSKIGVITDGTPIDAYSWTFGKSPETGKNYIQLETSLGQMFQHGWCGIQTIPGGTRPYDSLYGVEAGGPYKTAYIAVIG